MNKDCLDQSEEVELTDDDIIESEYVFEETGIDYTNVEVVDEGFTFLLVNRKN